MLRQSRWGSEREAQLRLSRVGGCCAHAAEGLRDVVVQLEPKLLRALPVDPRLGGVVVGVGVGLLVDVHGDDLQAGLVPAAGHAPAVEEAVAHVLGVREVRPAAAQRW